MEETIELFCSITGSDQVAALQFLQLANNDVNAAVQFYFDSISNEESNLIENNANNDDSTRAPLPRKTERIVVDDLPVRPSNRKFGSWFGSNKSSLNHEIISPSENAAIEDEDVIFVGEEQATTSSRSNNAITGGGGGSSSSSNSAFRRPHGPPNRFIINGASHSIQSTNHANNFTIKNGNSSSVNNHRLNNLFEPPAELLFQGSINQAAKAAQESNRWLLISLHFDLVFPCHRVNRDVWKNSLIQNIVHDDFVLWQGDSRDDETMAYMRFNVHSIDEPNLAIHHPISMALVERKSGLVSPDDVADFLSNFLVDRGKFIEVGNNSLATTNSRSSRKRTREPMGIDLDSQNVLDVIRIDDDSPSPPSTKQARIEAIDIDNDSSASKPKQINSTEMSLISATSSSSSSSSLTSAILQKNVPNNLPNEENLTEDSSLPTCRLKIRLPDGRAVLRVVSLSQPLEILIVHLEKHGYSRTAYELVQSYPSRSLRFIDTKLTFSSLHFSSSDTLYLQAI